MKKYNTKKISAVYFYTPEEIATQLKVHLNTVYRWIEAGLETRNNGKLILGSSLKHFLNCRRKANKVSLKVNEFYCPKCKKATRSRIDDITYINKDKSLSVNSSQVIIYGKCVIDGCKLVRYASTNTVKEFKEQFEKDV